MTPVLIAMGMARVLIGLAPFVAVGPSLRLLGIPVDHDNPTGRMIARLFGVRDIGLGVLVFWAVTRPETLTPVLLFNAATDLGDIVSAAIPLLRRQGIDRAAWSTVAMASAGCMAWLVALAVVTASQG